MYTILISDDEIIERNYLKSVINKYQKKYKLIGEAVNGQQAINMALTHKPNIIIMDINMPLCSGLEASKIIKSSKKNTIIILNSAYAEFEFARQAIDYNLDAYLLKPASEQNILETIDTCIQKKGIKGQVRGDFKNLSQNNVNKYPYLNINHLIKALHTRDLKLIQNNITIYLDFLKSQQHHLEEYRLHIINTIFTMMKTIDNVLPELQAVLKCDYYIQEISKAKYWYEILELTEEFFNGIYVWVKENSSFNSNCADLISKYIDECFQDKITLDSLSEIFHFHPSYISRVFHKNKGITINSYINKKRIEYALYLLDTSNLPIKYIAHNCGFVNISHFNRVFKKQTGYNPSQKKRKEIN